MPTIYYLLSAASSVKNVISHQMKYTRKANKTYHARLDTFRPVIL